MFESVTKPSLVEKVKARVPRGDLCHETLQKLKTVIDVGLTVCYSFHIFLGKLRRILNYEQVCMLRLLDRDNHGSVNAFDFERLIMEDQKSGSR